MKVFTLLFILLVSINSFPGEKGNGWEDPTLLFEVDQLEKIFQASIEVKEITLRKLSAKKIYRNSNGNIGITKADIVTMKRYNSLIKFFIINDEKELLESITVADKNFYTAMGITMIHREINVRMDIKEFEKNALITELYEFYSDFWFSIKSGVIKMSSEEKWNEFKSQIDESRLGYTLP